LYIKDELSYDKSWPAANRIYRIVEEYNDNGKIEFGVDLPAPMARVLKQDFPEVEKAGRLMPDASFAGGGSNQIRGADQQQNTYEEGFAYADQDLLDMLQMKMVYGDRAHALAEPNTIVLTRRKAEKYFFIESLDRIHPRYKVSVILSRSEDGNTLLTRWLNENLGKEVIATGYIDNRRFSADPFTIYLRTGTSDSKVYLAPNESSVNLEKSSKLTVHR